MNFTKSEMFAGSAQWQITSLSRDVRVMSCVVKSVVCVSVCAIRCSFLKGLFPLASLSWIGGFGPPPPCPPPK